MARDQGPGRHIKTGAPDHEEGRPARDIRGKEDLDPRQGAQEVSLSPAREDRVAAQPGLGDGHHVHQALGRLRLPRRHHRPLFAEGAVVAGVEHDGRRVLRVGARGSDLTLGRAGYFQHGPGQPVHVGCLCRRTCQQGHTDQHGREEQGLGQHLC